MSSIKCFDLSPQVHTVQALSGSNQNRRQKVVNKGTLRLCRGGLTFMQGGLDIQI